MDVAMIPARGGSKRIPRKNIKPFFGKPVIAYSIELALNSGLFERVIVSTDDEEIADIARAYGAEIPFLRPPHLSDDHASTNDVIAHSLDWLAHEGQVVDVMCCIQATAPFIAVDDLLQARALLQGDVEYVFAATEYAYPVARSFALTDNQRVAMLWPENYSRRSQDLTPVYHDAGMFYFGRAASFRAGKPLFGSYATPYLVPHYRVHDIDTPDDWYRAEKYYQVLEMA